MPGTQTPAAADGVTVDSLGDALDALAQSAAATDLLKGGAGGTVDANGIQSSGRVDGEDAKTAAVTGGGRAPAPKPLDNMMIGKLLEAGWDAGQITTLAGAMSGKATAEPEEDEDESMEGYVGKMTAHAQSHYDKNGSMKGYMGYPGAHDVTPKGMGKAGDAGGGEPMAKSIETYRADPELGPLMDGTDFFTAYVANTATQIDAVNVTLVKGFGDQAGVNRVLAGAVHQTGMLMKSQARVIEELGNRLGLVESTPQAPRGAVSTSAAAALAKAMPGEAGVGAGEPLKKSEIVASLTYMNLVKGMREIGGQRTAELVGMLEGGNQASEETLKAVNDFHVANPSESEAARTYQ